jgi:hypothetical protein
MKKPHPHWIGLIVIYCTVILPAYDYPVAAIALYCDTLVRCQISDGRIRHIIVNNLPMDR